MLPSIELNSKIWLVLDSEQRLLQHSKKFKYKYLIIPFQLATLANGALVRHLSGNSLMPFSLSDIYAFSEMMQRVSRLGPSVRFLCAGVDPEQQVALAFLLACHMIMTNGLGFEEAYLLFKPLYETIDRCIGNLAFTSSLRALCCAKCLNWIDFRNDSENGTMVHGRMDMDEAIHYSR
jgi:hypothetical protein